MISIRAKERERVSENDYAFQVSIGKDNVFLVSFGGGVVDP